MGVRVYALAPTRGTVAELAAEVAVPVVVCGRVLRAEVSLFERVGLTVVGALDAHEQKHRAGDGCGKPHEHGGGPGEERERQHSQHDQYRADGVVAPRRALRLGAVRVMGEAVCVVSLELHGVQPTGETAGEAELAAELAGEVVEAILAWPVEADDGDGFALLLKFVGDGVQGGNGGSVPHFGGA